MTAAEEPWYFAPSMVIGVGTRDAQNRPFGSRVAAARHGADGRSIILYVAIPEGLTTLANVSANGHVAVTFSRVYDYQAIQMKGSNARIIADPETGRIVKETVARRREAFLACGVPQPLVDRYLSTEAVPVEFTPDSVFTATPGAAAGKPVQL